MGFANTKGASGERQFCKWLYENFGIVVERELGQARDSGADVLVHPHFCFEVKRRETLDLDSWWLQATIAGRNHGLEPVVVFRQNRKPWEFLVSAKRLGISRGYVRMKESLFIDLMEGVINERIVSCFSE